MSDYQSTRNDGRLPSAKREPPLDSKPENDKLNILEEQARIARLRILFERQGNDTVAGQVLQKFKQARSLMLTGRGDYSDLPLESTALKTTKVSANLKELEDDVIWGDLKANVIYFKKGPHEEHPKRYDEPKLAGKFPNPRVPLILLLKKNKEENPLMWKCEDDMIRYFHIPANNMAWVEVSTRFVLEFLLSHHSLIWRQLPDITMKKDLTRLTLMVHIIELRQGIKSRKRECFSARNFGEVSSMVIYRTHQFTPAICVLAAIPSLQVGLEK